MNKKISEIMDDLECEWIKDIEEYDIEKDKRIDEVRLDRIKQMALENIRVMPKQERGIVEFRNKKNKKLLKKILVPLVATLSLIGITVAAISSSSTLGGTFKELFGEALPFIQSEIQDIKESITKNGIIFTAEAAAIENKAGLFIVNLEKEDGSTFEEGMCMKELLPDPEKRGGLGWSKQLMITEEGKKLTYIVDLSADKHLYGQKMSFRAKDLGVWHEGKTTVDMNLAEAFQNTLSDKIEGESWEDYESKTGIDIKILEKKPEYRLDRVEFEEETLNIVTSYPYRGGGDEIEVNIRLIDTRTNQEVVGAGGSGTWNSDACEMRYVDRFNGAKEADLPYLKMELEYRYFETKVAGEWYVDFELTKNENVIEKKLFQKIDHEKLSFTIHDLEVSKLGVKIEGWRHRGNLDGLEGVIQMKDGTKIALEPSGASSKWNLMFEKHYRIGEVIGGKRIEKEKKIEYKGEDNSKAGTITTGWGGIDKISVKTQCEDGRITIPNFVNIEEIESVIFEGINIPVGSKKIK